MNGRPLQPVAQDPVGPAPSALGSPERAAADVRRLQTALDATEEQYRALTEQIPAVTYLSPPNDTFLPFEYVSPQIEGLLGYPASMWTTEADLWVRALHPGDRDRAIEQNEIADARDIPYRCEYRLIAQDGSVVWVEDRAEMIRDDDGRPLFWHGVLWDVTARKRSEERLLEMIEVLRSSERQRARLAERLVRAQEQERHQIAQDLHDDPIQGLTALQFRLATIARSGEGEGREQLEAVEDKITEMIARLRSMVFDLQPKALEREGLAAAAREVCARLAEGHDLEWSVRDDLGAEPPIEPRQVAFRAISEALTNVQKHAGAAKVKIVLASRAGSAGRELCATIRDDGVGFDPETMPMDVEGHAGLDVMRERLELLGGGLEIRSAPGKGTELRVRIPFAHPD